jgi:hypothetical protein
MMLTLKKLPDARQKLQTLLFQFLILLMTLGITQGFLF